MIIHAVTLCKSVHITINISNNVRLALWVHKVLLCYTVLDCISTFCKDLYSLKHHFLCLHPQVIPKLSKARCLDSDTSVEHTTRYFVS